jgi:hypothetical protein
LEQGPDVLQEPKRLGCRSLQPRQGLWVQERLVTIKKSLQQRFQLDCAAPRLSSAEAYPERHPGCDRGAGLEQGSLAQPGATLDHDDRTPARGRANQTAA